MKLTLILQTFIKDEHIEQMYASLCSQIKELKNKNTEINIFIIQDNIKGYKKEKDPNVIQQFNKVKEINTRLSKNNNTTYLLVEDNMHPSPLCARGINYSFEHFNCDHFVYMEDDLILSNNFLEYNIFALQNLLTSSNICVGSESIYFKNHQGDSAKHCIEEAKKLINDLDLEKYYTTFNFLPSSTFGSDLMRWELIKTVRGNKRPTGATLCNPLFKEKKYNTILPIVPRCNDVGMHDDLGFSRLWHKKENIPEKNVYLVSNYNGNTYKVCDLNKDEIYKKTVFE